jgi:hypothetical protein
MEEANWERVEALKAREAAAKRWRTTRVSWEAG